MAGTTTAGLGGDAAAAALAAKIEVDNNDVHDRLVAQLSSKVIASTEVCQKSPTAQRCENALVQIKKQIDELGCRKGASNPTCTELYRQREFVQSTYDTWLNDSARINRVRQGEVLGSIAASSLAVPLVRGLTSLLTDNQDMIDGATVVTGNLTPILGVGASEL